MQALSNITWLSDLINDRHDKMACSKPRILPPVEPSLFNKLKRKTTDTNYDVVASQIEEPAPKRVKAHAATPARPVEKLRLDVEVACNATASGLLNAPSDPTTGVLIDDVSIISNDCLVSTTMKPSRVARLQKKIEAQINLEILLKHQELRLIEQELGKCQVALEQLRRCSVVPYPGESESPLTHEQVTTGSGPSLHVEPGYQQPQQPAPWGVVDGPYSRHYATWLLPDPQFDATRVDPARLSHGGKTPMETRNTRGSFVGTMTASRTHRGSVASKQQPMGYAAAPRDRLAPLLIKHPHTGDMVKLVCKYCGKNNISSVQGFLNHCRIAHEKNYESHGAAAIDCGVPLDGNEAIFTPVATEPITPVIPSGRPLVHPLITGPRKASIVSSSTPSTPTVSPSRPWSSYSRPVQPSPLSQTFNKDAFVPSLQTPRLSKLLQMRGMAGDLHKAVTMASVRVNLDDVGSLDDDDDGDEAGFSATEPLAAVTSRSIVVKDTVSTASGTPTCLLSSASTESPRSMPGRQSISQVTTDDELNHSPHMVDSNPGLISDNDDEEERDYDNDHDAESEHAGQDVRVHVHEYDADMEEVIDAGEGSTNNGKLVRAAGPLDATHASSAGAANNLKRKRGRPSKGGAGRVKGGR